MNWVHVVLGIVAGMVYSIFGWLKNAKEAREVVDAVVRLEGVRKDEAVRDLVRELYENRDAVVKFMSEFNPREFVETMLQGLVIGLFMGLLNLPIDAAVSVATQTGILTLARKLAKIIKP